MGWQFEIDWGAGSRRGRRSRQGRSMFAIGAAGVRAGARLQPRCTTRPRHTDMTKGPCRVCMHCVLGKAIHEPRAAQGCPGPLSGHKCCHCRLFPGRAPHLAPGAHRVNPRAHCQGRAAGRASVAARTGGLEHGHGAPGPARPPPPHACSQVQVAGRCWRQLPARGGRRHRNRLLLKHQASAKLSPHQASRTPRPCRQRTAIRHTSSPAPQEAPGASAPWPEASSPCQCH